MAGKGTVGKLTMTALLAAVALIIFVVEAQIPALVPVPGVKLGLANVVTLFAMFALGPVYAFGVLVVRVIIGGIFTGQVVALLYSATGGLLAYLVSLIARRIVSENQMWVVSIIGAIFHNIGQITVAILIMETPDLIVYLPVLLVSGIITGAFTGMCAQFLFKRLKNYGLFQKRNR
jgi:heptaprenyl diphosphate synthase